MKSNFSEEKFQQLDISLPKVSFIRRSDDCKEGHNDQTHEGRDDSEDLRAFSHSLEPNDAETLGREFQTEQECISLLFLIIRDTQQALALCKSMEKKEEKFIQRSQPTPERPLSYGYNLMEALIYTANKRNLVRWDIGLACALHLLKKYRALAKVFHLYPEEARKKFENKEHLFLDRFRVGLYKMCNRLERADSQSLIKVLWKEYMPETGIPEYTVTETALLELISLQKLSPGPSIAKFAQQLDHFRGKSPDLSKDLSKDLPVPSSSLNSPRANRQILKKGRCIILNQNEYRAGSGYERRVGTDNDECELRNVFENIYDCKTSIRRDKTKGEIIRYFKDVSSEDFSEFDYLVVVLLAHGARQQNKDHIVGIDGNLVDTTEEIYSRFWNANECPTLKDKLKLFLVQDYVVLNSTIPEYAAFRRESEGSFFIQVLCREFDQLQGQETLARLLNLTMRDVSHLTGVMMPEVISTYYELDNVYLMPKSLSKTT